MIDKYIRQYGKRLYGLCMTLCKDPFEADDLYQETWIKVVRYISQYDPDREFEPWLTKICVNTYRNALRRIARSPVLSPKSSEDNDALISSVPAPTKEDHSDLYAAIDRLPEKLRVTVILFYFRDMDISETGKTLGIPIGTVKSRLNKARKLLKEVLTDETDIRF